DRVLPDRGRCADRRQRLLRRGRVRARPHAPRADRGAREGGRQARERRPAPPRRPQRVPVGVPARHHARLARHRLPRRAGDRRPRRAGARRRDLARPGRRHLDRHRVRHRHRGAHHDRRAGPEDLGHRQGRARRAAGRPPAHLVRPDHAAVHPRPELGVEQAAEDLLQDRCRRDGLRGGLVAEGAARAHRAGPRRRPARPGRGRDALGRLPPARAGGPQRDD
ncbi:MAG: Magnesium and cobalt efflux protein CorC, partial [uncultured Solirubrobacteraceae bacterium]